MFIQPYLFFDGRCDEAIEFYKKAIGATVEMLMRFKQAPDQSMISPGSAEKVMHSCLKIGETRVMASDGRNTGKPKFDGFALSLDVKTDADAQTMFKALSDGGEVTMPLGSTFFATSFGMVKDRFGVNWMVLKAK
jgi:PhnB protein